MNGRSIAVGFVEFHKQNPHIFSAFESQALKAIAIGRKKLSAKLIINWIRWNEVLKTNGVTYKINDAYQSYYARLFAMKYPSFSYIFNFRTLRSDK